MLDPRNVTPLDRSAQLLPRNGRAVMVRPVQAGDEPALQTYFRGLSEASRYSRTLGAARELPVGELQRTFETDRDHHSLIVVPLDAAHSTIIGEARLAHETHTDDVEVSLSIADDWQRSGLGTALFAHLQQRASQFGTVAMYGDTLRSNTRMIGLAKKAGFDLIATPGDWRLVRFHKVIAGAQPIVIASRGLLADGEAIQGRKH